MKNSCSQPESVIGQDRCTERSSRDGVVCKHRANALVRINLPPLIGRRDAVLDAAGALMDILAECGDMKETVFHYLNGLFAAAALNTTRISGMFNNSDTAAREKRLAIHIGILAELASALDDFCVLRKRMHDAASMYADDPVGGFDAVFAEQTDERMSSAEKSLLDQFCGYFDRTRGRIARYRHYAVKNFSKDYLECYQKSYRSVIDRCNEAFEQLSVKI